MIEKDLNLLFGIISVQMCFITHVQLMEAAGIWSTNRTLKLSNILVEKGYITKAQSKAISKIISLQIESVGNSKAVLESLGGREAVHKSFAGSIVVTDSGEILPSLGGSSASTKPGDEGISLTDEDNLTVEHPGRYTIKGEQGRGGIGKVLIAYDSHLGRDIAVKELIALEDAKIQDQPTPVSKSAAMVARFLSEARITGQLEHPSIVPVYEIGRRADGGVYYTMKLVKGETLESKIRKQKVLNKRLQLLESFIDLCNAIAYAHSRGVIHRDLKPQNVMVGEFGETVVLDWGLAKVKGHIDETVDKLKAEIDEFKDIGGFHTVEGKALGTPSYMPPEQAEGKLSEIDERSDIYSLGAVLYEILTGDAPFTGNTAYEILSKVITEEPISVEKKVSNIPFELAAICKKAMAKDRGLRYSSVQELAEDIRSFISGKLVSAYEYNPVEKFKKWAVVNKTAVLTGIIGIAVLISFLLFFFWNISQKKKTMNELLSQILYEKGLSYEKSGNYELAYFYYTHSINKSPGSMSSSFAREGIGKTILYSAKFYKTIFPELGNNPCYQFDKSGTRLFIGGVGGIVEIYDCKTFKLVRKVKVNDSAIKLLKYNPISNDILTISEKGTFNIYDLDESETKIKKYNFTEEIIITDNGKDLILRKDNKIMLYDQEKDQVIRNFRGNYYGAITYDGKNKYVIVINKNENEIRFYHYYYPSKDKYIKVEDLDEKKYVNQVLLSESKLLVTINNQCFIFNTQSLKLEDKFFTDLKQVQKFTLSDNKEYLFMVSLSGMIEIRKVENFNVVKSIRSNEKTDDLIVSQDLKYMVLNERNKIKVWDIGSLSNISQNIIHQSRIKDIYFDEQEKYLVTCDEEGIIKIWDIETNREIRKIKTNDMIKQVFYNHEEQYLIVLKVNYNLKRELVTEVIKINLFPDTEERIILYENTKIEKIAVSNNGKIIAISRYLGRTIFSRYLEETTYIYDYEYILLNFTNGRKQIFKEKGYFSGSNSFSPDNKKFIYITQKGGTSYWVSILDLEKNKTIETCKVNSSEGLYNLYAFFNSNNQIKYFELSDKNLDKIDIENKKVIDTIYEKKSKIIYDLTGQIVIYYSNDKIIIHQFNGTKFSFSEYKSKNTGIIRLSSRNKYLAVVNDKQVNIYSFEDLLEDYGTLVKEMENNLNLYLTDISAEPFTLNEYLFLKTRFKLFYRSIIYSLTLLFMPYNLLVILISSTLIILLVFTFRYLLNIEVNKKKTNYLKSTLIFIETFFLSVLIITIIFYLFKKDMKYSSFSFLYSLINLDSFPFWDFHVHNYGIIFFGSIVFSSLSLIKKFNIQYFFNKWLGIKIWIIGFIIITIFISESTTEIIGKFAMVGSIFKYPEYLFFIFIGLVLSLLIPFFIEKSFMNKIARGKKTVLFPLIEIAGAFISLFIYFISSGIMLRHFISIINLIHS